MKIYVGNISYESTEDELSAEFGAFGKVDSVAIPADKFSGRPRGFAFVEMPNKAEADAAITAMNGKSLRNRTIVVNESKPRTENDRGGGFGGGNRGGGDRGDRRRY
jgi:cold-inducible RNA-binding protein